MIINFKDILLFLEMSYPKLSALSETLSNSIIYKE